MGALPQPRGRLPVAWPGPGREMIVLGDLLAASSPSSRTATERALITTPAIQKLYER